MFIKPLPHNPVKPVSLEHEANDVVKIEGTRFSGQFFRAFSMPENRVLYSIYTDGEVVYIRSIENADEAAQFFEEVSAGM